VALCEVCQADHDSVDREMNSKPAGPGGTRALAGTVRVAKRPTGQMRISESSQGRSKSAWRLFCQPQATQERTFTDAQGPPIMEHANNPSRDKWLSRTWSDTGVEEHARGEEEEMG
jgi:hypothetical protein